ncbi:hypothetical protein WJR50_09155 [Catalinimonas sp. 4WD22]|uniref:hypothetical protein n=1 Tax=Catalinimonas locisalis TaxID=3133978 RepID=UPI003100E219
MKKVTPYFFALLLIIVSFYYTKDGANAPFRPEYSNTLTDQYNVSLPLQESKESLEDGSLHRKGILQDVKNIFVYWNLSWYEIQYINNVNKQAVEEYKLAKTQEERNLILQKHPHYFTKIGRPLLSTCSR